MGLRKAKAAPQPVTAIADEMAIIRRVLVRYPEGTRLIFGSPTRCPDCGDFGLVAEVIPVTGEARNRCHGCGTGWVITRRGLRAHAASLVAEPETVVGSGVLVAALPEPEPEPEPEPGRAGSLLPRGLGGAGPSLAFP